MTLDEFCERAILVPFLIGGRAWSGWDCWGLVYMAHNEVPALGGPVSSYSTEYDSRISRRELAALIDRNKPEWRSISDIDVRPGDISLYRVSAYASHVALVVEGRQMLHSESKIGTVLEPLAGRVWAGRHVGYYRRSS